LVEQCVKYPTKEAVSHYGRSVTSLFRSMMKMAQLATDLDIPKTTLTTILKDNDSDF